MTTKEAAIAASVFHKEWLSYIKKEVGTRCTFLSHVSARDGHYMKVHITNKNGGRDKINFKLSKHPSLLNSADYQSLKTLILEKTYE